VKGRREPEPRRRGLERILSKFGVCSRAEAHTLIRRGRVRVNGVVILDPEAWFDPERDEFELDGRAITRKQRLYYALHKPRGYITTRSDPGGRLTVYELLGEIGAWVVPVGRLDLDTSGLLLFTNDTHFADLVSSPASHVPKTYRVECTPRLTEEALSRLARGVTLSDGPTRPAVVRAHAHRGPSSRFELTLTEGRNRQVRRMVKEVGAKVTKLARVSIGPLELGTLASGAVRPLSAAEVRALIAAGDDARGSAKGRTSRP
jgi:pseudouridine synthase